MDTPVHDHRDEARDVASTTTQEAVSKQLDQDQNTSLRPQLESRHSASSSSTNQPFTSNVTDAPPFWSWHGRSISQVSYQSFVQTKPAPIRLEDHSEEDDVQTQGCWARSVIINDYVVISGPTGIGAYVVWNCTVDTLKGGAMNIRKRYSEFDELRTNLVKAFPHAEASIPILPRKSVVSRFRPKFLDHRKNGLNHFMNCVLLNPEFAASPILKDFICS